jgi:hypothetical protein
MKNSRMEKNKKVWEGNETSKKISNLIVKRKKKMQKKK